MRRIKNLKSLKPHNDQLAGKIAEENALDEFLDDDGISHIIEGGLSMKIRYEMMPNNNSCKVYASIA